MHFRHILALPALLLSLALTACSSHVSDAELDYRLQGRSSVTTRAEVQKADAPLILLAPAAAPLREPTALFLPPRMRQSLSDGAHQGRELGQMVWRAWLAQRVFPLMQYDAEHPWRGPADGLALARAYGADLVVGGEVVRVLGGGSRGDSELVLRLEIYETATGALIWSMEHAGSVQAALSKDFIFFRSKRELPGQPLALIATALAADMARPVAAWIDPVREDRLGGTAIF